jgi:hypothetical protein
MEPQREPDENPHSSSRGQDARLSTGKHRFESGRVHAIPGPDAVGTATDF